MFPFCLLLSIGGKGFFPAAGLGFFLAQGRLPFHVAFNGTDSGDRQNLHDRTPLILVVSLIISKDLVKMLSCNELTDPDCLAELEICQNRGMVRRPRLPS